ncbi:MAG: DUF4298 domain-containing protein [Peptococcaceae bacterium]|nr:DUF4298 domain-containing protein [Peptococcaceae bacterium]MBO5429597.1 DUF4298 domain-containing protein [Peptococcaceae bacterium]
MNQTNLPQAIERIQQMELYFDALQHAVNISADAIKQDKTLDSMLQALLQYYEHGQWITDYTLDEAGLLPAALKRGVLSQDGLYNLLTQIEHS